MTCRDACLCLDGWTGGWKGGTRSLFVGVCDRATPVQDRVVQKYVEQPQLINGLKYVHLRVARA